MNDKVNTPQMTKKERERKRFVQNLTDFSHTRRTHPTIPAEAKKNLQKKKIFFLFVQKCDYISKMNVFVRFLLLFFF